MSSTKDYLSLHFLVFIWGFTAILGKLLTIPAVETVFFRTLLAFIGLLIYMAVKKKKFDVDNKGVLEILLVGVSVSAHWILFFAAAKVANVSIALAGMSTATLWTAILEPIMLKRKPKPLDFFFGFLIIIGLYVIFKFEFDHALGLSMAIISAGLSAFFSIRNYKLIRRYNHITITVLEMLGACIVTALFFPFYKIYFAEGNILQLTPTNQDWIWLLILSQVCTVYAFTHSTEIMKRLEAFTVNLTINLEPIYGIILAYFIFGDSEKMSSGFYLGGLIILLSVFSYPILEKKLRRFNN